MSQDVYLPGVTDNENSDLLTTATGLSLIFWGQIVEIVGQFLALLFIFLLGLLFVFEWLATAFFPDKELLIACVWEYIFYVITLALQICHLILIRKIVRYIRCGY